MGQKVLLVFGIVSSLLYVAMNVFVPIQWEGYSSASQTVSELSAIGAPTRSLWILPGVVYTVLATAFGWGVWKSAGRRRSLRIAGGLILAYGSLGLLWPFAPMHLRETLAAGGSTWSDTMHLVLGGVTVLLMLLAIGFGAAAFGKRFRVYSIASLVILFAFGALTFWDAPRVGANLPTPWIGVWERINIGVFLLWIVVLAMALLRTGDNAAMTNSAFRTPAGEVAFLAAYDAAMKLWPVPYEEMEVPSQFGMTHVIVSGPKDAPPLVLLHGYWATSTMWSPNVADFSRELRVYAIDVMGQPGKSIPTEPIRNAADYATWLGAILDGLRLGDVSIMGMSYGAWLALNFAIAGPERVQRLVLLSPGGGFHSVAKEFSLRGMLMMLFPTRSTVGSFMRWLRIKDNSGTSETRRVGNAVVDLVYLGLKHFQVPLETSRVMPTVFSDDQLRKMRVPTLLLMGDEEVIWDPAAALARARQLFPDVQGELVPRSSHDMCFSQHRIVDARVLDFLKKRPDDLGYQ
jgi:pimeloyl-ACP methyl ester carboxylesterase